MNSRQRTISIALATLVLFGGMIEVMKSSQNSNSTQAIRRTGLFGLNLDDLDDSEAPRLGNRPSRVAADRARSRLSGRLQLSNPRLGGLSEGPTPATQAATQTDATATLADPKKINTADAGKKKAEADKKKKKKKKKKKTNVAKEPGVEISVTDRDEAAEDPEEEPMGGGAVAVRAAINNAKEAAAKEAADAAGEMNSLEDWIAFILPQPSYERTMKMLQELQAKRLEPGIFHEVVAEMIADPRQKMQELGIVALGSYPSLQSYLMLQSANLKFSESSPLKVQSRNFLKSYSRAENLRYLGSVLTARVEESVIFEALRLITSSADLYSGKANTSSGNTDGTPQPIATPANVVRQFQPLVPVLNRLANTSTDESIRQQASTTLRQVQVITGT